MSDEKANEPCTLAMPSGRGGDVPIVPGRPSGSVTGATTSGRSIVVTTAAPIRATRATLTRWTASMIRPYPVQRQTLPASSSRITVSVGAGSDR